MSEAKNRIKVFNDFKAIEEEMDLFSEAIHGVYFWKIIRYSIYFQVLTGLGLFVARTKKTKKKSRLSKKLEDLKKILFTEFFSYISRGRQVDTLVFEWRKVLVDGKPTDIYSKELIENLKASGVNYEIVCSTTLQNNYPLPSRKKSYSDDYGFKYIKIRKNSSFELSDKDIELISKIEKRINKKFEVELKLKNVILSHVRGFSIRREIIRNALKKRKVKQVYLTNSSSILHGPIVAACNDLGIKSIEQQHGVIHEYHPMYNYGGIKNIPYLTTELHLWGQYWSDSNPSINQLFETKVIGSLFFNKEKAKYSNIERLKKSVAFMSQGPIGKQLFNYAVKFALENKEFTVFYKLHPNEYKWFKDGIFDVSFQKPTNLIFYQDGNIYPLLFKAEYVCGVSSTAIFEALACGCKGIIVDLPSVETIEFLYKNNYALLVSPEEYSFSKFDFSKIKSIEPDYYFEEHHTNSLS